MARVRSLSGRKAFQETYEQGVKRVGRLLVVYLMATEEDEMAVVASRKVGDAVRRNRAKRLLREALRREVFADPECKRRISESFFPTRNREAAAEGCLRVVAIARADILSVKCQAVCQELRDILCGIVS